MSDTKEQIRRRYAALLGENRLAEKIAAIAGTTRATVFRWFDGGFPDYSATILELLETIDRE